MAHSRVRTVLMVFAGLIVALHAPTNGSAGPHSGATQIMDKNDSYSGWWGQWVIKDR